MLFPTSSLIYSPFFYNYYRVIEGFQDRGGLKEFLFALPRFAKDEVCRHHYS